MQYYDIWTLLHRVQAMDVCKELMTFQLLEHAKETRRDRAVSYASGNRARGLTSLITNYVCCNSTILMEFTNLAIKRKCDSISPEQLYCILLTILNCDAVSEFTQQTRNKRMYREER